MSDNPIDISRDIDDRRHRFVFDSLVAEPMDGDPKRWVLYLINAFAISMLLTL